MSLLPVIFFFSFTVMTFSFEKYIEIKELKANETSSIVNKNVAILFYVENCSKSRIMNELVVQLSKESQKMELSVDFFRINVNENPDLASKFLFIDAPHLMLILGKYNLLYNYNGDSDLKEMVYFLKKKLLGRVKALNNIEELYFNNNKHMLIFCGINNSHLILNETEELTYFYDENVNFTVTNSTEVMNKFDCKEENNDIILFLNKEEVKKYHVANGTLKEWLEKELIPLIFDLSIDKLKYIIDNKLPALIYFIKYSDNSFTSSYNRFYQLSKRYKVINYLIKDEIIFLNSFKSRSDVIDVLQEMFSLMNKDMPAILGINFNKDKLVQYILYKSMINEEKELNLFLDSFLNNSQKYLYTHSQQDNSNSTQKDGKVNILTGLSIKNKIVNSKKDVIVFVEDSISCLKCSSIYSTFKDLSENIVSEIAFARIDYSTNDLPDIHIGRNLPKILFFPHDEKSSNKYLNFKVFRDTFSKINLIEFIKNFTTYPLSLNETYSNLQDKIEHITENPYSYSVNKVEDFNTIRDYIDREVTSDIFRQKVEEPSIEVNDESYHQEQGNEDHVKKEDEETVKPDHEEDDSSTRKSDL